MNLRYSIVCVALALWLAPPATAAQNHTLTPIVLRGEAAPGTASTFLDFELPFSITENGAAFVADLSGINGGNDAVYADVGAGLELVALSGAPAPGFPGASYADLGRVQLNASGKVVYYGSTWDGVTGDEALFRWASGNTTVLLKEGDAAPSPGIVFASFNSPSLDDAGVVVFWGDTDEVGVGSYQEGIFELSGGVVTALVWGDDTAPGTGGGEFGSLGAPHLNAAGDVAFAATVTGGSAQHGIFRASGGALEALVLQGDVLPGTGGGTADWLDFSRIDMNAAGTVAFVADVVGASVVRGVFTISAGVITPVALNGDVAPGSGGAVFDFLRRNVAIDEAGEVAYRSDLSGGSASQGLFRGGTAVALLGEPLPGTGGGFVGTMSERPAMTASGATGFKTNVFQGVGGSGLFRGTPPVPAVPGLSPWAAGALALLLASWGAHRLGEA